MSQDPTCFQTVHLKCEKHRPVEPLPGLPQVVLIARICTQRSHILDVETSNKNPTWGGVNTFCSSHSPCSLGKTLNVLPPKCPESCGLLQMKVQGGGQPLILPPLQSPFQDQSCCVCSPVSHNKSFPRGERGTTERFTTELFKFCWKRMTVISHSCSATTPAFISRLY